MTTEELLSAVRAMSFNAPVTYVQELCERLANATDSLNAVIAVERNPRQLELPL